LNQTGGLHVALLRGINVGGKNKLKMTALTEVFADAGCHNVQTYIQSGNVVYRASDDIASRVPELIADRIAGKLGLRVPVVTRTASEFHEVVTNNPFLHAGHDPKSLAVAFLADLPTSEQISRLDPDPSPPDEFVVRDREIYLFLPNGAARSKLTNAYFDSRLGTTSTARNWRTVLKLDEMVNGPG